MWRTSSSAVTHRLVAEPPGLRLQMALQAVRDALNGDREAAERLLALEALGGACKEVSLETVPTHPLPVGGVLTHTLPPYMNWPILITRIRFERPEDLLVRVTVGYQIRFDTAPATMLDPFPCLLAMQADRIELQISNRTDHPITTGTIVVMGISGPWEQP